MNLPSHNSLLAVGVIVFAVSLSAQEKKEPAQRDATVPDQSQANLPKIDLPEFLITGQETIDLPVSLKSMIEEDKVYVAGSPTPGAKDAGIGSGTKVQKDLGGVANEMSGRVQGGIGNYTSPFLDGWFGKNYDAGGVLFHANYASTSGQVTNADWQKTGIGIQGDYLSPKTFGILAGSRLNGGLDFSGQTYKAYGSSTPSQQRTLDNVNVNLGLSSRTTDTDLLSNPLDYSARISWSGTSLDDSTASSQNDFGLLVSGSTKENDIQFRGSMEYIVSGVSMQLPPNTGTHAPEWFDLRLSGEKFFLPDLEALVSVQQFIYRGNVSTSSGRFFPGAELRYFASDAATVYFSVAPTVERNTLGSLVNADNYIQNRLELRPNEIPFALTLGTQYAFSDRLYWSGSFSYYSERNFPFFVELNSAKVWDVMYLPDVSVARFDLEGSYAFNQSNSATLSGSLNSTQAKDSANAVPNIPLLTLSGIYRHSFSNGIVVELFAEYFSQRWKDFSHTHANAGYVNVGGKAEYQLFENFRALLQVDNLLDRQYYTWDGYVERPLFASLGVSFAW